MRLIVAVDRNWGIGHADQLLFRIREDQIRFKQLTTGGIVILGRKTLSTFPSARPLKDRINLVLTRQPDLIIPGALICLGPDDLRRQLLQLQAQGYQDNQVFVIGGSSVYDLLLPYCESALVTFIEQALAADRFFPNLDQTAGWQLAERGETRRQDDLDFHYRTYIQQSPRPFFS